MYIYIPLELIQLLLCTKECFTISTYNLFVNFIWCLLVSEGKKTTRNIYRYCFFFKKNLASWERLLSQYKWSILQVIEKLFDLLVDTFPEQFLICGAYTVAYDSSLIAKNSKKIPGVQKRLRSCLGRFFMGKLVFSNTALDAEVAENTTLKDAILCLLG
ncbi:MAG: hypothetical protein GYA02_01485 [Clostridiaceae bacterium]|nr:hypothetical protein [Clostridiaceae bacterium]